MEFEIKGTAQAELVIDLKKFKHEYRQNLDIDKAVKKSYVIKYLDRDIPEEKFVQLVSNGLLWDKIIEQFDYIPKNEMSVKLYEVDYKDWPRFTPGHVSEDGRHWALKETRKSGQDIILVQSFIEQPSFTVKNFVDVNQFQYGKDNTWGRIFVLENKDGNSRNSKETR